MLQSEIRIITRFYQANILHVKTGSGNQFIIYPSFPIVIALEPVSAWLGIAPSIAYVNNIVVNFYFSWNFIITQFFSFFVLNGKTFERYFTIPFFLIE